MPPSAIIAALRDHIAATVPGAPPVSTAVPTANGDVPRITVSLEEIVPATRGIGRLPSASLSGALRVDTSVDLADPVLRGAEVVQLLSPDRLTLQLPHGAVVRASGDDTPPYGTGDLRVRLGATTFTPVHQVPAAGQVRLDIPSGALTFPSPLPAAGTLELGYFIGIWDVRVERFSATVHLDVAAADEGEAEAVSTAVEAALTPEAGVQAAGFRTLEPRALSASTPIPGVAGQARSRRLTYVVEHELIVPVIPTSGGPIREIDVDSTFDPIVVAVATERFEIT